MRTSCPDHQRTPKATAINTIVIIKLILTTQTSKSGGEGGIRTPEGCYTLTVFKTAAIDHSATSPTSGFGRAGGTRTPNRRFWRPLLYQLSYRPTPSLSDWPFIIHPD